VSRSDVGPELSGDTGKKGKTTCGSEDSKRDLKVDANYEDRVGGYTKLREKTKELTLMEELSTQYREG